MPEALEIAIEILENGLTIVTLLAVINVILTWYESRRKRRAYERMENKLDAALQELGVTWTGQQNESEKALQSLKRLYLLYSAEALKMYVRSVKKVKLSKAWLSGVIAYLLGQLAIKWGFTFNDQMADAAAEFIITFILPFVVAFLNRTKKENSNESTIQPGSNK